MVRAGVKAYPSLGRDNNDTTNRTKAGAVAARPNALHFWDLFQYRSPWDGAVKLSSFHAGLEVQMRRHQELYLPLVHYAPDIFGMRHPSSSLSLNVGNSSSRTIIDGADMAVDIRERILGEGGGGSGINNGSGGAKGGDGVDKMHIRVQVQTFDFKNFDKHQQTWGEGYSRPLVFMPCTGRIVRCLMSS